MISSEWIRDLLHLKRTPRAGWLRVGIESPESVADHSFGAALLGWRIARSVSGVDAERVTLMLLLHDFHEAKLTDLPNPWKKYFPEGAIDEAEERIIAEQWPGGGGEGGSGGDREGDGVDAEARALLAEFRARETPEAQLAAAVDHLEFLLQAAFYRAAGRTLTDEMLGRRFQGPAFAHPATRAVAEKAMSDLLGQDAPTG